MWQDLDKHQQRKHIYYLWCGLGCSEKGWKQKILTATPPIPLDNHINESNLIKRSGMVPKACGKRLTEWPILPSKMSLKIAKKWKSSLDRLLICQMWKIISGLYYWLNSDLFRPKKIVFRSKIAIFRCPTNMLNLKKRCWAYILKMTILDLKTIFLGLNRSEFIKHDKYAIIINAYLEMLKNMNSLVIISNLVIFFFCLVHISLNGYYIL